MSIKITDYFMGRDKTYARDLTPEITSHAGRTVEAVNALLARAAADGVLPGVDSVTHTAVGSGWRPPGVNSKTANAAHSSPHLTGEACDIRDTHDRSLARWACSEKGRAALSEIGLWCERPQWTPTWLHVQTRPSASGHRFFVPSVDPPLISPLPNEGP